ncbi:hypothetical protein Acr_04g0008050 [Actinidia rufa]|uniref:Uncharacterized protein n=1 Tax=Actinidia rufa TaxID=165716 RepID=A0A7J0EKB3_9ERIC|nr:hypothetical protein Acr_04g0008050 [Actinidia rufa]
MEPRQVISIELARATLRVLVRSPRAKVLPPPRPWASRNLPRPSASSPLDNRAPPMANASQVLDLEAPRCQPKSPAVPSVPDVERSRHSNRSGDRSHNVNTERARVRRRAPSPSLRERSSSSESSHTRARVRRGRSPNRGDHTEARDKSTSQKIRDLDARLDAINTGTNAPVTVDALVRQTDPPFTKRVLGARISSKFKLPTQLGIYEGKTDPMDHLDSTGQVVVSKTIARNHRLFWRAESTLCRQFHELQKSIEECFSPIHHPSKRDRELERFRETIQPSYTGSRGSQRQKQSDKYIAAEELAEAKRRRRGKDDHKRKEPDTRRNDYREETRYKRPDRDPKRSNNRRPLAAPSLSYRHSTPLSPKYSQKLSTKNSSSGPERSRLIPRRGTRTNIVNSKPGPRTQYRGLFSAEGTNCRPY